MLLFIIGTISGLLLGITGGGGAIITVPLLVYLNHSSLIVATTLSLVTVFVSSLLGVILKRRDIRYVDGVIFALVGSIAAPFGVRISHLVPENILITVFAILMLIIAGLMIKKSYTKSNIKLHSKRNLLSLVFTLIAALVTGFMTGLFGVGGGFMIVPALVLLLKMENKVAVATSLFIISIISLLTLSGIIHTINMDYMILYQFIAGGVIGMFLGVLIAKVISNKIATRLFGIVALGVGLYMLVDAILRFI